MSKDRHTHSLIEVVGMPASGKTTFSKNLSQKPTFEYMDLDTYAENPFLTLFARDPQRYAFHTGLKFSSERAKRLPDVESSLEHSNVIMDQGFHFGLLLYSQDAYENSLLTKEEWDLLKTLHYQLFARAPVVSTTVVLDVSIDILENRITERLTQVGRGHEAVYDFEYLKSLKKQFDMYVDEQKSNKSSGLYIFSDNRLTFSRSRNDEDLLPVFEETLERCKA